MRVLMAADLKTIQSLAYSRTTLQLGILNL
jgi:hypothetical protein